MSSQIGRNIKVSLFGESHGNGIGAVIDGFPAGMRVDFEALTQFMKRRTPGRDTFSTPRKEADIPQIISGMLDDITCGTPIACIISNKDTQSGDYGKMSSIARPGHADYSGYKRYSGYNDVRGGGHFSARLTAPLVFAGGLCKQLLQGKGITVGAHIASIKNIYDRRFDPVEVSVDEVTAPGEKALPVLDDNVAEKMRSIIESARLDKDSVGGIIEVAVLGLEAGLGSPIFGNIESRLSEGFFGIPAVKGIEFGAGFEASLMFGSENNDEFYISDINGESKVKTRTNNHGGILGGISTGMPVIARIAFKPTPSIAKPQNTVDYINKTPEVIEIQGRHDPCVVIRAVPVVEAITAIIIADILAESGI